jgi:uncharacterized OB-fold protein
MTKAQVPAIEGWFTTGAEPALLGSRCTDCGTYFFPKEQTFCRNPACRGATLEQVPLSRRGTVWSYTTNHYAPPAPYVSPDPFVPYSVAAVELADEKLVVLGQVAGPAEDLKVGREVQLVVDTLFEDDDHEYVVWKWRPISSGGHPGPSDHARRTPGGRDAVRESGLASLADDASHGSAHRSGQ